MLGTLGLTGCSGLFSQESNSMPAQYVRTYYSDRDEKIVTTLIQSKEELDAYYEANKDTHSLVYSEDDPKVRDDSIGYLNACEKYTDEYFEENKLVLISIIENSGSITHNVKDVIYSDSDNELCIMLERHIPYTGSCDEMGWHIFVELIDYDEIPGDVEITVDVEDVQEGKYWWE